MAPVTIRDVAREAGVGIGTVSRVLNNSTAVSDHTRRKVQDAIERLNYTPNPAARRLSLGKTMTIGVIVPFFTNPSVVERLRGIVSGLSESEYDLMLFDIETPERRAACLREVTRRERVDGLLILSLRPSDEEAALLSSSGVPTVLVDAVHPRLSHVFVDNFEGAYQATIHLIGLGHRRIGFISDYLDDPFNNPARERYDGYRQALDDSAIPFRRRYHRQGEHSRQAARLLAHDLLDLDDPPTAVFAYSDTQATGVLQAARERGLRVPGDLSLVGYDDIEIAEYLQLTTIRQSLFESGVAGVDLLLEEMAAPSGELQEVELPTELIIRATTAPLRQATYQRQKAE